MNKLRSYLKANGITQAEFAKSAEMTQGNVAKLCGPRPRLTMNTALKIERLTGREVMVESWPQFAGLADRADIQGQQGSAA